MESEKATQMMLERWQDDEWRERISLLLAERWQDLDWREQVTSAICETWQDPELRARHGELSREHWQDPKYRQRMLGFLQSPENRARMSQMMLELWQDPEFVGKVVMERVEKIRTGYRTDIERITEEALLRLGIDYEFEYQVGRYSIDFYLPGYGIAVECDGEYWHRAKKDKDARRDVYLEDRGLTMVHLYGPDIRQDIDSLLAQELLPLIES
jgi:very-short-patch-repair endonuclease